MVSPPRQAHQEGAIMKFTPVILALSTFVAGCGGGTQPETPSMGLPAWDGAQIVCNETVSFAADGTSALPVFPADERLGLCARSMRYIELNRQYGGQTSYFGVAATTTASLAATYAPLVRRAYSKSTWDFMAELSRQTETTVNAVAQKAGQGGVSRLLDRVSGGALDAASLIRAEQRQVQAALEALRARDQDTYTKVIEEVNGTFNPTNRMLIAAINRNPFFRAYEAGLAQVRARHGGAIDFADMQQRIEIGDVLQTLIEAIPAANYPIGIAPAR